MKKYKLPIIALLLYILSFTLNLYGSYPFLQNLSSYVKWINIYQLVITLFILIGLGALLALIPSKRLLYKTRLFKTTSFVIITFSVIISCLSIYNILNWEYGFNDTYNQWTAKEDIKNNKIQIIESPGLKIITDNNEVSYFVKDSIARKYGFRYVDPGCTFTSNGFEHYNKVMYNYLNKRNGKGWQKRFEKELENISKSKNY